MQIKSYALNVIGTIEMEEWHALNRKRFATLFSCN